MIDFPRKELDALLATDKPGEPDEDFCGYGHTMAGEILLRGQYGRPQVLSRVWLCAFHRSDDQSHAAPGGFDLEFETADTVYEIELRTFVSRVLLPLSVSQDSEYQATVVALCNPDLIDLSVFFAPLVAKTQRELYWAQGEVLSAFEGEQRARVLECRRWNCLRPTPA